MAQRFLLQYLFYTLAITVIRFQYDAMCAILPSIIYESTKYNIYITTEKALVRCDCYLPKMQLKFSYLH